MRRKAIFLTLWTLLLYQAHVGELSTAGRTPDIQTRCPRTNVIFVMDDSNSIWSENIRKIKSFIANIILRLPMSRRGLRVGLVTFSVDASPRIHLSDYFDRETLALVVSTLPRSHQTSSTDTHRGLRKMRTMFRKRHYGAIRNARNIGIIITDGNSTEPTKTRKQASLAHEDDIQLFAVGVYYKQKPNVKELEMLAGERGRKYQLRYDDLRDIEDDIVRVICPEPSTSTMSPSTSPTLPTSPRKLPPLTINQFTPPVEAFRRASETADGVEAIFSSESTPSSMLFSSRASQTQPVEILSDVSVPGVTSVQHDTVSVKIINSTGVGNIESKTESTPFSKSISSGASQTQPVEILSNMSVPSATLMPPHDTVSVKVIDAMGAGATESKTESTPFTTLISSRASVSQVGNSSPDVPTPRATPTPQHDKVSVISTTEMSATESMTESTPSITLISSSTSVLQSDKRSSEVSTPETSTSVHDNIPVKFIETTGVSSTADHKRTSPSVTSVDETGTRRDSSDHQISVEFTHRPPAPSTMPDDLYRRTTRSSTFTESLGGPSTLSMGAYGDAEHSLDSVSDSSSSHPLPSPVSSQETPIPYSSGVEEKSSTDRYYSEKFSTFSMLTPVFKSSSMTNSTKVITTNNGYTELSTLKPQPDHPFTTEHGFKVSGSTEEQSLYSKNLETEKFTTKAIQTAASINPRDIAVQKDQPSKPPIQKNGSSATPKSSTPSPFVTFSTVRSSISTIYSNNDTYESLENKSTESPDDYPKIKGCPTTEILFSQPVHSDNFATNKVLDFLKQTVQDLNFDKRRYKVGVLPETCKSWDGFDFGEFIDSNAVAQKVDEWLSPDRGLSLSLRKLRQAFQARSHLEPRRKVGVLIVNNGYENFVELIKQARAAKEEGIEIVMVSVGAKDKLRARTFSIFTKGRSINVKSYTDLPFASYQLAYMLSTCA